MCFSTFMINLDTTVVNVALPSIQRGLHASSAALEWTINAYLLAFAALLVTGGRLGDLFGRRRMFLAGVALFGVSSTAIGFSRSVLWLAAWRAVQGAGAAAMQPATMSILTNTFAEEERGRALGLLSGLSALGLAFGPVLGGVLVERVSWQSIFFINVPFALAAIAVTRLAAPESRDESVGRRIDIPGVVTISVTLGCLVLALMYGSMWGWGSARELALFAIAGAGLAAFVIAERRSRFPIVELRLLRSPGYAGALLVAFVIGFAFFAPLFYLALFFQDVAGYSPIQSGFGFLPATALIIVAAPRAGRLADRVGPRVPIVVGLSSVTAALLWLSRLHVGSTYLALLPGFALLGIGVGMTMSPMTTAAMYAIGAQKAGVGAGIVNMSRLVGGMLGIALTGIIVTELGRARLGALLPGLPAPLRARLLSHLGGTSVHAPASIASAGRHAFSYGVGRGLLLAAGVSAVGAISAWALIARRRPD